MAASEMEKVAKVANALGEEDAVMVFEDGGMWMSMTNGSHRSIIINFRPKVEGVPGRAGRIAVPAKRLKEVVRIVGKKAEVELEFGGTWVEFRAGRSRVRVPGRWSQGGADAPLVKDLVQQGHRCVTMEFDADEMKAVCDAANVGRDSAADIVLLCKDGRMVASRFGDAEENVLEVDLAPVADGDGLRARFATDFVKAALAVAEGNVQAQVMHPWGAMAMRWEGGASAVAPVVEEDD